MPEKGEVLRTGTCRTSGDHAHNQAKETAHAGIPTEEIIKSRDMICALSWDRARRSGWGAREVRRSSLGNHSSKSKTQLSCPMGFTKDAWENVRSRSLSMSLRPWNSEVSKRRYSYDSLPDYLG